MNFYIKKINNTRLFLLAFMLFVPFVSHAQGVVSWLTDTYFLVTSGWQLLIAQAQLLSLLQSAGQALNEVLSIDLMASGVVAALWNVTRGFANMFFILVLIIMAFGTIFNVSGYDFKRLLARFIVAALLINFSLIIGGVIIDWTQSLANVFISSIGDVSTQIIADTRLGNLIARIYGVTNVSTYASDSVLWSGLLGTTANILMISILLFSYGVALALLIIRIPILWMLLAVAPIAWITYILPSTRSVSQRWWKYFLGWNIFLPLYLFFLYCGVYVMRNRDTILNVSNPSLGFGVQDVFFYVLLAVFMIGGAKFAMSSSMSAGAGGVALGTWARASVFDRNRSWIRAGGRYAGKGVGAASSALGVDQNIDAIKERFRTQGFAGFEATEKTLGKFYRGQQGRDEAAVWLGGKIKDMTGVDLAPGLAEKQFGKRLEIEEKKLKDKKVHLSKDQLTNVINTGTPEQKIAAAKLFNEENFGSLTPDQFTAVRNSLGTNINTALGASIFRKMRMNEMSTDELNTFLEPTNANYIDPITDPTGNLRNLVYNALIEKKRITPKQFETYLDQSNLSGAQRALAVSKAKELLGDDMLPADRKGLFTALGRTPDLARDNKDALRELLKIMAQKGDKFFHDDIGDPIQSQLSSYADMFENPSERKTFLENVAKKHADNVAQEMLTRRMLKDDAGNIITDTQTGLKMTLSKLSIEEKLSQDPSQYLRPHFQQAIATDMSKNINSLENYLKHDKYPTASPKIRTAEGMARDAIYASQFLEPFAAELKRANELIRKIRSEPYEASLFNRYQIQSEGIAKELTDTRRDYEKLCRKNNMLDKAATEQIKRFDASVQRFKEKAQRALVEARTRTP